MADIRKNFVYNIIWNISTYVVSLITFPYISRVLGAEALGITEYVHQFIQYFILFSLLGVVGIGTREIASCKDNKAKRSETFSSILGLSAFLTFIVLVVYFVCVFTIPTFIEYQRLFMIGAAQILFTTFQIEWLYRGIENFKYTTIRNIAIRILYVIALFLFIKTSDDYELYFTLTVLVVVLNAIVNLVYARHFVNFTFDLDLFRNTWKSLSKQFAVLGANTITISFYSTFNVVYLGLVCTKADVGYYSVSNKIMTICMGVVSAFTLVMLPRMSSVAGNKDKKAFDSLIDKSFSVVLDTCIPICIMMLCYAPYIVRLLSGGEFDPAITPLRIVAPVIVVNALAQVVVYQVEMPLHKDKNILYSSIIAAVVGVVLNLSIVKGNGAIGSAMVLCFSVLASFLYNFGYCLKNNLMKFPVKKLLKVLIMSVPYVLLWVLLEVFVANEWWLLGVGSTVSLAYWCCLNRDLFMGFVRSYFKKK